MKGKYVSASPVSSLDHLMTLDRVIIFGRIWHKSWFQNLQIGLLDAWIHRGVVRTAVWEDKEKTK